MSDITFRDMNGKFVDMPESVRKFYYNQIVAPDPFNAITNMIVWHEDMKQTNPEEYAKLDSEARQTMTLFKDFFFIHENIAKAKILYLDEDLLPSVTNTDNEIFFRNTGLPVMFINQDFKYEGGLIKGILVANAKELTDHMDPTLRMEYIIQEKDWELFNSLLFMWVFLDFSDGTETWMSFTTNDLKKYPSKKNQQLCKYIGTIASNIIDLMNHDVEAIDVNVIDVTREENEKRIRKGKIPVCRKVHIRPKSEVRNYYINFNRQLLECGHATHKFLVRGHWRHFRSSKWKNKQGTSIWIKPQIRGKGIFIEKQYKLEDKNEGSKDF